MYLHSYIAIVPLVDFYGSFCITVVRSFSLGMVVGQCRFTDFATDFHFFSLFYCDTVEVVIAFLPPPPPTHTPEPTHFDFYKLLRPFLSFNVSPSPESAGLMLEQHAQTKEHVPKK